MSAVLRADAERRLRPMKLAALDGVLAAECSAYAFPWTRNNFVDSIAAGYLAQLLEGPEAALLGYFVAMPGVDEMHLLNITVVPAQQGRGHARFMLDSLVCHCRSQQAQVLWLEVRQGNERALRIYRRYGFRPVGVRKGYYPAANNQREDACVMSLEIPGVPCAVE